MTDLPTAPMSEPLPDSKPPWESKTMWAGLLTALIPLFPPVSLWVAANPALYSALLGAIFAGLRLVTKDKVSIT